MAIKTYNPKDVIITVDGVPLHDFTDGDFISIEYKDDTFTSEKGADGEITRNYNPSLLATATITLKGGSPSNDLLSGIAIQDRATLTGIFPFFLKDANGTSLVVGAESWITKQAPVKRGTSTGDSEWTIEGEMVIFTGGNS